MTHCGCEWRHGQSGHPSMIGVGATGTWPWRARFQPTSRPTLTSRMTARRTAVAGSSTSVVKTNVTSTITVLASATRSTGRRAPVSCADAEVTGCDEGEDDQRDHTAERGDRREIEPDGEDHGDDGRDEEAGREAAAEPATEDRRELADGRHLLAEPASGVEAGVRRAGRGEQGRHRHHPVTGPAQHRLGGDRQGGPSGVDHLVDGERAEHTEGDGDVDHGGDAEREVQRPRQLAVPGWPGPWR